MEGDEIKRTCDGCKALSKNDDWYCTLGYKITNKKVLSGIVLEVKPLEECPKPKTNDEYTKLNSTSHK